MPHPTKASTALAWGAVVFAVVVWGGSFVAARHLLNPEAPDRTRLAPLTLAAVRFAIASLFFVPILAAALRRGQLTRRDLWRMVLLGQIAFSTYFWLQYTGVQKTNAGLSSILAVGLMPSVTAVLAPKAGEERTRLGAWAGLLLGFLGVGAIVLDRPFDAAATLDFAIGALCLTGNAVAFAVYSLLSRRWMKETPPLVMTAGTMVSGTAGLLVLAAIADPAGPGRLASLEIPQWGAILYLALACSVGGYAAWTFALSRIEASRATVWIYTEPVTAMALGALVLGERYGAFALAGTGAVALSVIVTTRARS